MQILFVVMKMKRTNSICIFLCIGLVALALIFFAIAKTSEKDQREAEEEDRMLLTENSSIPSASEKQAKYMVLLENDTVVVYEIVDWKKYLTTDIAKERLPEDVVEDLRDGMRLSSEKDLFAFLENYSS